MISIEAREAAIKRLCLETVCEFLEEGQDLSTGDKLLVKQEINAFIEDHKAATGRLPQYFWEDTFVWVIRERLQKFGFTMPCVERAFRSRFHDMASTTLSMCKHTGNLDAHQELMRLYLRVEVDDYYPKPRSRYPFPYKTWQQVIEDDIASCS